jgi:hypothetical protein
MAAVAYFDLQTNFPFLDEYARRWTIDRLANGRGLVFWGSSPNLVGVAAAMPLALLHTEPRVWRLAGLLFLALAATFAGLIARRLGADSFWAAVAGAALVLNPVSLGLATGMMTETAFVAMLLGALWSSLRWIGEGRMVTWAVVFVVLATLQREQGIGVAVAISAGLLMLRGDRPLSRRDIAALVMLWALSLTALVSVQVYRHLGPSTVGQDAPTVSPVVLVTVAIEALVILMGFFMLPFAVALARRGAAELKATGRLEMLPVALAVFGLAFAGIAAWLFGVPLFIGYIWGAKGIAIAREPGKPDLLPALLLALVEFLTIASVLMALGWRRRAWSPSQAGRQGAFLVLSAAIQFSAIIVTGQVFDRYYLMVLAPLVPLVAAVASRTSPKTAGPAWAVAALAGCLALYVVGEQDFQAWIEARDRAAQAAYAQAPPAEVSAGFEEEALHVWIPAVDNPGAGLPQHVSARPRLVLVSTGPDDPRPGFSYSSISPGKIVIVAGGGQDVSP